jgi:hypothetical protein
MLTSSGDCENAIGWIKLLSQWRQIARRRFGFQSFARASTDATEFRKVSNKIPGDQCPIIHLPVLQKVLSR